MIELSNRLAEIACKVLRQRRLELNLSQDTLSQRTGFARSYISDVERGSRHPTLGNLIIMADALEWSTSQLIRETEWQAIQLLDLNKLRLMNENKAELSRLEEEIYRYVTERISQGVVMANRDGRLLLFNKSATLLTGVGLTDSPMDEWASVYGCYEPDRVTPMSTPELPLVQALTSGRPVRKPLFLRNELCPEGRLLQVVGRQLRDESGAVRGAMVFFEEIPA